MYVEKNLYLSRSDFLTTFAFPNSNPDGPFPSVMNFNYFLRVYKTVQFWKRVRFEQTRPVLLSERRGFFVEQDWDNYKQACDKLGEEEKEAEDFAVKQVFEKLKVDP